MPKIAANKKPEPVIVELPPRKMAVVQTEGDPNVVLERVMPALYGAAYALKFALKKQGREYKVGALVGRWPDAHLVPKDQWTAIWGLEVPADTEALVQKDPGVPVSLETWDYGAVAEVLHIGTYAEEGPVVQGLHQFIDESGFVLIGEHEEEYLTRPGSKVQKTIIRHRIQSR